jgi:lipid-A-disaccharide synthase
MAEPLKLFVLAGEPSGDRLGADLIRRVSARAELQVTGVGGAEMEGAGLRSIFPMSELAVMGWADVLPRLPLLLWRVRQVANAILQSRPDVTVLIDAQVFSKLVAERLRKKGYTRPVLLYVAPAVWGWKPERAPKLTPLFDEILSILPFERAVMQKLGGPPTTYVGHPAVAGIPSRQAQPASGPLLLLPGSRVGELHRHLPVMRSVAERFSTHTAVSGFVLPTLRPVEPRVRAEVARWPVPVSVVTGEAAKLDAFARAVAAVAVTGTVTLELAIAGVPMVTTYLADRGQVNLWLKYKPRFASLPNVLLSRELVPEVLGIVPEPDRIAGALASLLDGPAAQVQFTGFAEIRALMRDGLPNAPLEDAAARVLAHAQRPQRLASGT